MNLRFWLLVAGALAGYIVLMRANPIRDSLRDGLRCLRRYPALWITLAVFGVCYAAFHQVGLRLLEYHILPEGERPVFQWVRGWFLPHALEVEAARAAFVPALESVAGIFNNVIATFPFSAVAALLLLVNWKGHHMVLNRALRRRFGSWGWALYAGITVSAVAAVLKPFVLYGGVPILGQTISGTWLLPPAFLIDWLSILFEYLFGVCIQIYLILLVDVWVLGAEATPQRLLDFAIRRFSAVMKWAAVVLALSSLAIYLPQIVALLPPFTQRINPYAMDAYVNHVARPAMAFLLIGLASVQITLTFHSESLRQALRDHFQFVGHHAVALGWFLLIAWVHFYAFHFLNGVLRAGLGEGTASGLAWQLSAPLLEAFLAAWLLASWVCWFKKSGSGRSHDKNWVAY
jgi:hypothetical protein